MRTLILLAMLTPLCLLAQRSELADHRRNVVSQFLSMPSSPIDSSSIHQLSYFPESDSFRYPTLILPLLDTATLVFPTSTGAEKQYRPYAKVFIRHQASMHALTIYESPGTSRNPLLRDRLFLPFWDETNGFETYGGGRYLEVSRAAVDDRSLVLDFNRAYNPWCAYSDGYSCPIPPPQNRLDFAVLAGEAIFALPEVAEPLAPAEATGDIVPYR